MSLLRVTLAGALLALAAASTASAALTPSSYQSQAKAICSARNDKLAGIDVITLAQTTSGGARIVSESYTIDEDAYERLRALQPPASLAADHSAALWASWRALTQLRKIIQLPGGGTAKTAQTRAAWNTYRTLYAAVTVDWKRLGVPDCEA